MNSEKKSQLLQQINETLNADRIYPFKNREDLCEGRTSYDELRESADAFYQTLLAVQRELQATQDSLKCPRCGSHTQKQHRYNNGDDWRCPECYIDLNCDHTPQTRWANEQRQ